MIIRFYIVLMFMVLALSLQMAATSGDSRNMLDRYLDQRIENSARIGRLTDSAYDSIRHMAELERQQAEHFRQNRDRLMKEMQALDLKPDQIEPFLLKDFYQHHKPGTNA